LFFEDRFPESEEDSIGKTKMSKSTKHAPVYREHPDSKGIVVFIHGFMGSPQQFSGLFETAYRQGYSVAALLLPGHGGSARNFATGTLGLWQNHVDNEVERFSHKYLNIFLVGHSMGGLLALNSSIKYSSCVHGLYLLACPFIITSFSPYAFKLRLKQVFSRSSNPIKSAYLDNCSVTLSPNMIWCTIRPSAEVKKLVQITESNLPKVRVPVTAVYSYADELTSIKSLDILKAGLHDVPFGQILLADSTHAYYTPQERSTIEKGLEDFIYGK